MFVIAFVFKFYLYGSSSGILTTSPFTFPAVHFLGLLWVLRKFFVCCAGSKYLYVKNNKRF
ncbi:hypothetical protein DXT99_07430 [Pontibacter diazotrophicus]|uniref:Uncharacterized protein n=1 Tax=Pontibacter diazotrophicus TaxID=1400979 RepID=A0A3D8LEJ2_9BACT|nr:hypothetical protein DXT99_07430 [Pontibacter diazotrophicus]